MKESRKEGRKKGRKEKGRKERGKNESRGFQGSKKNQGVSFLYARQSFVNITHIYPITFTKVQIISVAKS